MEYNRYNHGQFWAKTGKLKASDAKYYAEDTC